MTIKHYLLVKLLLLHKWQALLRNILFIVMAKKVVSNDDQKMNRTLFELSFFRHMKFGQIAQSANKKSVQLNTVNVHHGYCAMMHV